MSEYPPELCGFRCPERLAQLDTNTDLDVDRRRELIAEAASRMSAMVVEGRCSGWCSRKVPSISEAQVALTTGSLNGKSGLLVSDPSTGNFAMKETC